MKLSSVLNTKKSKFYWLYILVAVLFAFASAVFLPIWVDVAPDLFFANWGYNVVQTIISVLIFLYVIFFLIKRLISKKGNFVVRALIIVEITLLSLTALGGILSQFNVLKLTGPSQILGLALWLRGSIEVFRAYYYKHEPTPKTQSAENSTAEVTAKPKKEYTIITLLLAIAFISLGVYLFTSSALTTEGVLWIVCSVNFIVAVISIILSVVKKPIKEKKIENVETQCEVENEDTKEKVESENSASSEEVKPEIVSEEITKENQSNCNDNSVNENIEEEKIESEIATSIDANENVNNNKN